MIDYSSYPRHGKKGTKVYRAWAAMRRRCYSPSCGTYRYHGARGITVCQKWRDSFPAFLADMGEPMPGLSLDRINNDGNYEPGNCRWADTKTQNRNTRNCYRIHAFGESKTLVEWSEDKRCQVNNSVLRIRLRSGKWLPEDAITIPTTTLNRALGSECGTSKLEEADIPIIRDMYKQGHPIGLIAEKFGLSSKQSVLNVVTGKTWSHVVST